MDVGSGAAHLPIFRQTEPSLIPKGVHHMNMLIYPLLSVRHRTLFSRQILLRFIFKLYSHPHDNTVAYMVES